MSKFYFLMQHIPTNDQIDAAYGLSEIDQIIALNPGEPKPGQVDPRPASVRFVGSTALLNVPDDPRISVQWFLDRAQEILRTVAPLGLEVGDVVQVMGQGQLVNAVNFLARLEGAVVVESVTARESVDEVQADGSTKKIAVFRFRGFRPVYDFSGVLD